MQPLQELVQLFAEDTAAVVVDDRVVKEGFRDVRPRKLVPSSLVQREAFTPSWHNKGKGFTVPYSAADKIPLDKDGH